MTDQASKSTKEKIISVTIQLIREEKDVKKITMREIAKRADLAVSVINYHFQTKENLINKAVQAIISSVVRGAADKAKETSDDPIIKLENHLKQAVEFIVNNPGIARVSILNNLTKGSIDDNSYQVFNSIYAILKEIFGDSKEEITLKMMAHQQLATVQVMFLRSEVFKEQTGFDFFDAKQRERLMDILLNNLLCNERGE